MESVKETVHIHPYEGDLALVAQIHELVQRKYRKCFRCILVHGSCADDTVIPYSDFDGLLIVKDEYVNSRELDRFKSESMALILQFDPLQHHGWFEIQESKLNNYSPTFLPKEVLLKAKWIYSEQQQLNLELKEEPDTDFSKPLQVLLKGLKKKHQAGWRPKNMYQLKSFLSEIMLLPTFAFTSKHRKGIYKRDSFVAAKELFSASEWSVIERASEIRLNWSYSLNTLQRVILTRPEGLFRKMTKRIAAPAIPRELEPTARFYANLGEMLNRLENVNWK